MKILYHHRTRSKDGQYVHIEEMINALREQGHEVIVVAPPSAEREAFGSEAGLVSVMKRYLPRFVYELIELAYALVAYRRLTEAIRRHKPDCLYERYNLYLPAGVWAKRRHKLPMLLEVNSPLFEERAQYDGISLNRLARWSQKYVWQGADYVLPVTQVLADIVASYGVPETRIAVVPNGINARQFEARVEADAAKAALGLQGYFVLGFTGFVREWHGLDKVIDMIASDPPDSRRCLLVVGDGPARPALERKARQYGIQDRVRFTGVVAREDVARHVCAFDIALQPAVVTYASPLKLFEYLALGKAIVGPSQANLLEILTNGYNAVLFEPGDANGLPSAISRLCNDAELRREVGENARRTIKERGLTWQANAEKAVALFERLAKHA